ncbi:TorF family putative porin [Pseudomonas mediterranea]|uniref:TorF family putative porin n=1 Tax=Pseudomonas mediterranea TaxID=183795 RepID=UPI0006D8C483|nr:TorF family putative porin [Pseudomonas mediterranea]MDU9027488.1 TorF family putative porin [Pseudomonas mediterranea]
MLIKSVKTVSGAALLLLSMHASALQLSETVNANLTVNLLSDYRSNGVSQTKGDPAIQGELVVIHDSGLLGGLWMSSVDFGTKTRREEGGYVGIYKEPIEDLRLTATIGQYMYPKNSSYKLTEFYGVVEYKNFRYNLVYDYNMEAPNAKFQYFGFTFDLPYDTKLYLEYGIHDVGNVLYSSSGKVSDDYQTKKLSLKKSLLGVDWSVSYIDTSITDTQCTYYVGYADSCQGTVVFGASKTF